MAIQPSRGEIWIASLDPTRGHEQAGERPVLIVSANRFNRSPAELVFILPLTRTNRRIPAHIQIDPPEGGIHARSFILCDGLRSIAKERLGAGPWGKVSPQIMSKVENRLQTLLEL